ncbi:uncharacterized protein N7484_001157 [Penicillium longicatenatum]|uniref:uncharacterized protein n=1 Tax=Penicillium longicatenatum TaxID=1561947 RepID=UPI002549B996|nr:uncharacterized protein N7484_001157 [Penicillium longicatenatum]KAJ5657508.1 hypothetical protein N7484_001157 [Penicillium longicatenatum]
MSSFLAPVLSDAGRHPITRAGLRLLARRYIGAEFESRAWGESHLFQQLWGEDPQSNLAIIPLATNLSPLLAHLICAVSTGGLMPAWVLRMVLTPEFLWLGLHQTSFSLMEVGNISPADICRCCPLVAAGNFTTNLSFDESWVAQRAAMELFLRVDPPAAYNIAVGTGDPEDIDMDRASTPITSTFPEPLAAPPIIHLPPPPMKSKQNRRDERSAEVEIETEERSSRRLGAVLGWVPGNCAEYQTSTFRPSAAGASSRETR